MNVGNFDKCGNFKGVVLGSIAALILSFLAGFCELKPCDENKYSGRIMFILAVVIVIFMILVC